MKTKEDRIQIVLDDAAASLEGENYHDMVELPDQMFKALRRLVPPENHLKLAQKIAKVFEQF